MTAWIGKRKAELLASAGLLAYVIVRFLSVGGTLSEYHVNAYIFLALDIVTIPPYSIGGTRFVKAVLRKDPESATGWALLWSAGFLIPYIYIIIMARQVPPAVWVVLGLIVALLTAHAVLKLNREIRAARQRKEEADASAAQPASQVRTC